jgi:hypothetical protein
MAITGIVGYYALSVWAGLNFWAAWAIALVAVVVNGWIAAVEDNSPSGFNNPKQ